MKVEVREAPASIAVSTFEESQIPIRQPQDAAVDDAEYARQLQAEMEREAEESERAERRQRRRNTR